MIPNRYQTMTTRVDPDQTGLKGSFYVHVGYTDDGKPVDVRFSHKWRGADYTMDGLCNALGDAVGATLKDIKPLK